MSQRGETGNIRRLVRRYDAYSANWQVYVLVKGESVLEHPENLLLTTPPGCPYIVEEAVNQEPGSCTRAVSG
ncbi:MAG: hypothetical protein QW420_03065 [Candidatus Caldarchaeum sp.]